jgi:speckle-type POZ protein
MVEVTHVFNIFGYSKHRGIGNEKFISSGTFSAGGHDWRICFYPDGYSTGKLKNDFISVFAELSSVGSKVRASCDLRLVDQTTGLSSSVHKTEPRMFIASEQSRLAPQTPIFKNRSEIEESVYLQDDHLTIECVVTVMKEPKVESDLFLKIDVPRSDIGRHLGKLLEEGEGFDVSFDVGGETFEAHRLVLAMRLPVFKAELYGSMREASTAQRITIEDMQPAAFRALLYFIYTDSLPASVDLEGDETTEMIPHLLVAADRYAMERLKLVCQSILCKNLNAETVTTTLALAERSNCTKLSDACLKFITTSKVMDSVVKTHGYNELKSTCPSILLDVLEKISRLFCNN